MNLDDLSAEDLAAIDSVCLEFENRFGAEVPLAVEQAVKLFIDQQRGTPNREHIELLRQELVAIENELLRKAQDDRRDLRAGPTPFQSKTRSSDQVSEGFGIASVNAERTDGSPSSRSAATEWMPPPNSNPVSRSSRVNDDPAGNGPSMDSVEGSQTHSIGPYEIGRILARGGMGVVYRALDTRLDRPVAIKMMGFPSLGPSDPKRIELVERFEREAKAVAALSHPNIVELFDVGVAGSVPYAVMEFLSGLTLADQLVAGPMSPEQTCQIGMQIAGALATAHAAGVIHRDLKPQNVMLVDNKDSGKDLGPRVKLVDFGLSRVSDAAMPGDGGDASQTRSGMILGTPGYMAPEQARGESATSAADMFGFGCVLYEVFYGKPAIPGETPADRLAGTLKGEVEYDHAQCKKSQMLCELISECLRKDPTQRPAATDVYGRLRQFDLNAPAAEVGRYRQADLEGDPTTEGLLRRHLLTTLAGGLLGGMLGGLTLEKSLGGLAGIRSLAVLTLRDGHESTPNRRGMPLADRKITEGEILASALVNELSAVDGLAVLPYRPQTADTPDQFQKLGVELGVDAFLTGTFQNQTLGQSKFWVLNWQLVSAADGSLLHGEEFVTEQSGDNRGGQFLAQSAVASNVAKQIGRALVTTGQKHAVPDAMSYGCMMKGRAYADADSAIGLRQALKCFDKAHEEDPRRSEPLAARAVAALNLAARSDPAESLAHLENARSSMTEALDLDPHSVDARLAEAMLEWQSLHHYEDAFGLFEQLHQKSKFNWQVEHQRGLLLAALGMASEARDALSSASKLNPMSMLVKTDRCRGDWFFGFELRAIRDVTRYRNSTEKDNPARKLAIGLLVDIYEEQGDFEKAAVQLDWAAAPSSSEDYFRRRRATLRDYPYGPFGASLNRAIFDSRAGADIDEGELGVLNESGATMFPLLLARHPAFDELRETASATDYLPPTIRRIRHT